MRELETKQLRANLDEARAKLIKLRFGVASREVKNIREVRSIKKEIARLFTVIGERQSKQATEKIII